MAFSPAASSPAAEDDTGMTQTLLRSFDVQEPKQKRYSNEEMARKNVNLLELFSDNEFDEWHDLLETATRFLHNSVSELEANVDALRADLHTDCAKKEDLAAPSPFDFLIRATKRAGIPTSCVEAVSSQAVRKQNYIHQDECADAGGNTCVICKTEVATHFLRQAKCRHEKCEDLKGDRALHECPNAYFCMDCACQVYYASSKGMKQLPNCPLCRGVFCPLFPFDGVEWTYHGKQMEKQKARIDELEEQVAQLDRELSKYKRSPSHPSSNRNKRQKR